MTLSNIQAIIFDFGGVLLDWNPRHLYRKLLNEDQDAVENFLLEIGFTAWNQQLDLGKPFAEGIAELSAQFPHHHDLIRAFHERWAESIAGVIPGTVDILRTLKDRQYPLYGLSNFAAETFYQVRDQYEFFGWFDLIVLSGEIKLAKPDPAIFHWLLEKIGYPAEQCVFIDDSIANVDAAAQLGFHAIRFESPAQLQQALEQVGVRV